MDKKNIFEMDIKDLFKSDMKINPKNILYLVAILMGVILYGYLVIYPQYNHYKSAKTNLNTANNKLLEYTEKMDKMPILRKQLTKLDAQIDIKSNKLAYDMRDGMFLVGLSNQMKKQFVSLVDYTLEEPVKYENFYAVPTTIKLEGKYGNIRNIMFYLEEQKNVTQIQNFDMKTKIPQVKVQPQPTNTLNPQLGPINLGQPQKLKASGDVVATFKFVMYMSQKPTLKLQTENPKEWKPGKANPFVDTTN